MEDKDYLDNESQEQDDAYCENDSWDDVEILTDEEEMETSGGAHKGSSSKNKVISKKATSSGSGGHWIKTTYKSPTGRISKNETWEKHLFRHGVCIACGYRKR